MPRVTSTGLTYLAITGFVMVAAINSGTNLLYITFGFMVSAFLVSILFSFLSLRKLTVRRILPGQVVAGEPAPFQYLLTNEKFLWPAFAVHITELTPHDSPGQTPLFLEPPSAFTLHIGPHKTVTLPTQLIAATRGIFTLPTIRLTSSFPFGFVRQSRHIQHDDSLVVYPRIGALNRKLALRCRESTESGSMTASARRGNDEFYGLREYRAGDNIRSIHWRSTARTGQLTIREMANNAPPQMIVVLNLRNAAALSDPFNAVEEIEYAIELTASLLCYAFLENFSVALAIPGLDTLPPIPRMGRETRAALLHRLATLNPDDIQSRRHLPIPNRLASRAEWIIISLQQIDPITDLYPSSASFTLLALDHPDAKYWLTFSSSHDTLRLLRESQPLSSPPPPPIVPTPSKS